jgi:hypothetical protein
MQGNKRWGSGLENCFFGQPVATRGRVANYDDNHVYQSRAEGATDGGDEPERRQKAAQRTTRGCSGNMQRGIPSILENESMPQPANNASVADELLEKSACPIKANMSVCAAYPACDMTSP